MKKRGILICALIFVVLFSMVFVSASFKYYGHSLEKKYRAGGNMEGSVNISFEKEDAESVIRSNLIGNTSLINFLTENGLEEGVDFECSIRGCNKDYAPEKEINEINLDKESVVGVKLFGGNIDEIGLFEFIAESSLESSCQNPLEIDILSDGKNVVSGVDYNDVSCSSNNYGCFNKQTGEYSTILIEDEEICETINMNNAPAYRIGARIVNSTDGIGRLRMTMYNSEGNSISCMLPSHSQSEQELDCIVKAIPTQGNYSVCIESLDYSGSGRPKYKLKSEKSAPICGSLGRDFEIFSKSLQYGNTKIEINHSFIDDLYSTYLEDEILDYLKEKYGVSSDGSVICEPFCIIPIKFKGPTQTVKVSNVDLLYSDGGLTVDEENYKKIYSLKNNPARITSSPLNLDLSAANLIIPLDVKNKTLFQFYLNDQIIFKDDINVEESFDFAVSPRFVLVGITTRFEAVSKFNITSSKWDFGDGSIEEADGSSIRHTYIESDNYKIKVELRRKDGITAIKTFELVVGNPKESVNRTIRNYMLRLDNIAQQVEDFPASLKEPILESIEFEDLKDTLLKIEADFKNSSEEDEYSKIMEELLALTIPSAVGISKEGNLPLAVGFDGIDETYIEEISKKEVQDEDELKDKIVEWMSANYKASSDFNLISTFGDEGREDILTQFKFKIEPISDYKDVAYLFINYPFESIHFKQDYGQKAIGEGEAAYIPVGKESKDIEFYIEEGIEIYDLGAYISPPIQSFVFEDSEEDKPTCLPDDEDCQEPFPLTNFLIGMAIVLVSSLAGYILLQEWYKRHYERHLFKNPQDLYNLINFIYNSRVSGISDIEIKKKLKAAGWNGEKIAYAFKKIDGRRTGMWEIPLFKGVENRRVQEEIAKRHNEQINTKFIKQPRF